MSATLPHQTSEMTRPFWEAAAQRVLVRPVCNVCGTNFFTPQIACTKCHSESWAYQQSSGQGAIASFTVVHRAPTSDHEPPYVVAVVDLDEGWFMMSNIVACSIENVHTGQRVQVDFELSGTGVVLPVFRPVQEDAP